MTKDRLTEVVADILIVRHDIDMRARIASAGLLLLLPQLASAQLTGRETAQGCIRLAPVPSTVSAEGTLTLRTFPGAPNYESIAAGDEEERVFILEMPRAACVDDEGEFADPSERFTNIHLSAREDSLLDVLRAAVGRRVAVSGEGLASHTGHHRAPLVIFAERISVR